MDYAASEPSIKVGGNPGPNAVRPNEGSTSDDVRALIASVPTWYHVIELGPGIETPGTYDMRPAIPSLGLPSDLSRSDVLDVGSSDGFFSFHFERAGARTVVAADLFSILDHDYPRWWRERFLSSHPPEEIKLRDYQWLHAGFGVAHRLLRSKVAKIYGRVYDLPGMLRAEFDLVFCCNVLLHLRDPVLGLEAMRLVLAEGGLLVLVSPVDLSHDASYARFIGSPDSVQWWIPSTAALVNMAYAAGFGHVDVKSTFQLAPRDAPERAGNMAVVHCRAAKP